MVTTLMAAAHWDYYSDHAVSRCNMAGHMSMCYRYASVSFVPSRIRPVMRSCPRGGDFTSPSKFSGRPLTGSNPTMIDLINWGE